MQDTQEAHTEHFQMSMRDELCRAVGTYRGPKDEMVLLFVCWFVFCCCCGVFVVLVWFWFILKYKFSYVILHEFKPFGGTDNLKWKLYARISLSPTLGK